MEILDALQLGFEMKADESLAIQMEAYMKNHFKFYGVKSAERKKIVSIAWLNNKITLEKDLYHFMNESWSKKEREWQYASMDIMGKCKKLFSVNAIEHAERLITNKSWWDTVDWLSSHVVGYCFMHYPEIKMNYIQRWMASDNILVTKVLFDIPT